MSADNGQAAVANAREVDTYPVGMCLKYVRAEAWRIASLYGSAIDAWHGAYDRHPGDREPPVGAPLFYEGGQHGHVVVNTKAPTMRGTDMPSSGRVSEADIDWPVTHWGVRYLGWTGDLNGVTLPLDSEEDDMQLGDPISQWSPDEGEGSDTTVGKTLNQARGYAEDAYDRVRKLEGKVDTLTNKVDKILSKLG